jgi:hypothetical protein
MEKDLASNQLNDFNTQLKQTINDSIKQVNINDEIKNAIKQDIILITNEEKTYISESSKYFLIVFGLTFIGLFISVYTYYFICKYTLGVVIDWTSILISLLFIIICIIGFEVIYFIYILLNKKINNQKILKYFIDNI